MRKIESFSAGDVLLRHQRHENTTLNDGDSADEKGSNDCTSSSVNSGDAGQHKWSRSSSRGEHQELQVGSAKAACVLFDYTSNEFDASNDNKRRTSISTSNRPSETYSNDRSSISSASRNFRPCCTRRSAAATPETTSFQDEQSQSRLRNPVGRKPSCIAEAPQGVNVSTQREGFHGEVGRWGSAAPLEGRGAPAVKRRFALRRGRSSGVIAARVVSALGAPSRDRRASVHVEVGDESADSSDSEIDGGNSEATRAMRRHAETSEGTSWLNQSGNDASSDCLWLLEAAGVRDASAANLVDTLESIMDKSLRPVALSALQSFGCLRHLILVQQHIKTLKDVGVCRNLQILHLPENQIENLDGIESCKHLEILDLSGNRIAELRIPRGESFAHPSQGGAQRNALEELERLHTLRLSGNRLQSLTGVEALTGLKELQVADNQLTHVGEVLRKNEELETLNVAANYIWSLQDVTLLSFLPSLKRLLFSDVHFLSKQNPICRLKNHEMFTLYHLPRLRALNQTLLDSTDSLFVTSTYQRKRLYYLLEQHQIRRCARDALKTLELFHGRFRVVAKERIRSARLSLVREELCSGASFFCWAAGEVRKRREVALNSRRIELERFGNIHLEQGDKSKTWYRRTAECILRSFSAEDFSAFGFKSVQVKSIHRVVNKEAEAAFELLRVAWETESDEEWILCGANPEDPQGLIRCCFGNTSRGLFSQRSELQKPTLIFASNGLAEADLPRLRSLANNDSIRAVARHVVQLNPANCHLNDWFCSESSVASASFSKTSRETGTAAPQPAPDHTPLQLLQEVVREGQMLLPDGEVLLCRALLHEPLLDSPADYNADDLLSLRENGPTQESVDKALELYRQAQTEAEASNGSTLLIKGPTAIYRRRCFDSQRKIWWFLEPHCITPHFLVRFSYSRDPAKPFDDAELPFQTEQAPPATADPQTPLPTTNATPSASTEAADLRAEVVVSASAEPVRAASTNQVVQDEAVKESSRIKYRGRVYFQDLISVLKGNAFLSVEMTGCPRKPIIELPESDALRRVLAQDFVLEVPHLQEMLSEHFSSLGVNPAGSWGCFKSCSTTAGKAILRAGDCNVQLDSHGDIVSLTLSSIAHLVALSQGVLLTFSKLRVLLLPLNGLRSFAPRTSAPACENFSRTSKNCSGPSSFVQLPQLKVLDLSFNELCTLDGFWETPRLQQLCLVANHLLLVSDLAPIGTAAPQLRQLWIAGNPLYVRPHISQPLQQLLPALELVDGHSLLGITAEAPDHLAAGAELPLLVHEDSPPEADAGEPHPHMAATEGPLNWDLATAAQLKFQGAKVGQRYCTCRAEDAQLLACSFVTPKLGPRGMLEESRLSGSAEPLPLALLLPACAGPSQMCCCFCCCCCSCSKQDALYVNDCRTSAIQWSAPSNAAVAPMQQMNGCGGLCSVAAAIRAAALSHWDRLYDKEEARTPLCSNVSWANWRENVDVLEMSFLRLRDAPNIQSFVGLRRLELSENRLKSIESLLGLSLLEELLLDGNNLEGLNGIESFCRLECLDVSHNNIADFPPGMQQLKRLMFLCAEANTLQQLQPLEGLPSLTQLYLSSTKIDSFGSLIPLCRCSALRVLDLRGTPLSKEKEYRSYSLYLLSSLKVLDGVEPDQKETAEIKHAFAGRLTRELLEQIVGRPLPCLEGSVDLSGHRLRNISNVIKEENFPFLLRMNLSQNKLTSIASLGTLPLLRELALANNNIDITAGGLGGSEGPGLSAVPLLERLDLSFNTLRELKGLEGAPLGSLRVLELRGNGLTKIEGLLRCCRLEVLDLSDNRIRRIEAEGFQGASETLRCLILERNGLRTLNGLPCLPNLEDLRVAKNRIPDLTHAEHLLQLPKLKRLGFQQNPACQRRHWRALLAQQLPHLEAIDDEAILLKDFSRAHLGCITEGALRESDHALSSHNTTSEDTATTVRLLNSTSQQHNLLPQYQRLIPHSTKPTKSRLLLPSKQEEVPCSGPSLPQATTSSDLRAFKFGVVGVGAPGAIIEGDPETSQQPHESLLISSGKRRAI
ncbi:hypothetical protein Esti_005720 [Eimeria stiedai]